MDITTMSADALVASLAETREKAAALFALDAPTVAQVNEAETLVASINDMQAEQARRTEVVKDAGKRFAAARQSFAVDPSADKKDPELDENGDPIKKDKPSFSAEGEDEGDAEGDAANDAEIEVETEVETEDEAEVEVEDAPDATDSAVVTAAAIPKGRTAAKKVGRKAVRPAAREAQPVTITAAADVPGFSTGAVLEGMDAVSKALQNRVKGFAPFNARSAEQVSKQSGGEPVLNKFGVASFGVDFSEALTASAGNEYAAVQNAVKQDRFSNEVITAAGGWCAPSEPVYNYIADYVIDGLVTVPEVSAPRGGLLMTTGPARSSQGTALDDFGFVQTEAQAIAGTAKTCETIVCPPFVDHRLDAIGYCYKIPLLTQKAYPELITDALKFAGVLYAHKVNKRIITDMVALAVASAPVPLGASFTDALEALSIVATKERRKWSIGVNAVMEVKLPEFAREVFRADMSRRNAVAVDAITNQQIDAHFTARNLAVEYVADWQELTGGAAVFPATFDALIYPAGTFVKAVEDVVNLSAVYDAASLAVNEYTGVFFEQGIMVAKAGYGATKVTIPVCTAGLSGAAELTCA